MVSSAAHTDEPSSKVCCGSLSGHPLGHSKNDCAPPFTSESYPPDPLGDELPRICRDVLNLVAPETDQGLATCWVQRVWHDDQPFGVPITFVPRLIQYRSLPFVRHRALLERTPRIIAAFAWQLAEVVGLRDSALDEEWLEEDMLEQVADAFEVDPVELAVRYNVLVERERRLHWVRLNAFMANRKKK